MPELPEVETVRRALAPVMEGACFLSATCNRPDLRFPFPKNFTQRLQNVRVDTLARRGKYLQAFLSSGDVLIMHLGMSGRFSVCEENEKSPGNFHHVGQTIAAHDHVEFRMLPAGRRKRGATIIYNDPRRFGFMDLVAENDLESCKHFKTMGPEPLSNYFSQDALIDAFAGRKAPVKQALLDQRSVAGLGNIYVCEALFRAGISPKRMAGRIGADRIRRLHREIRLVLEEAIEAGGSSLKDFASSDGSPGYFQHDFRIYDREGEACRVCATTIRRVVQGGRSTFYCPQCQR